MDPDAGWHKCWRLIAQLEGDATGVAFAIADEESVR
jgi:hypothetical protein